ncbi:hypothetical protein PsYK624_068640 [Phanerochaete sordida]|uniref:Uncharacterized protein n=1 Tax=Phanerochaete sordida TaxID=48140 RepID=A0A9P3GB92_9APHY|nr:hypothetical protein PsYK624_068640 [Phanerochaete sordida]
MSAAAARRPTVPLLRRQACARRPWRGHRRRRRGTWVVLRSANAAGGGRWRENVHLWRALRLSDGPTPEDMQGRQTGSSARGATGASDAWVKLLSAPRVRSAQIVRLYGVYVLCQGERRHISACIQMRREAADVLIENDAERTRAAAMQPRLGYVERLTSSSAQNIPPRSFGAAEQLVERGRAVRATAHVTRAMTLLAFSPNLQLSRKPSRSRVARAHNTMEPPEEGFRRRPTGASPSSALLRPVSPRHAGPTLAAPGNAEAIMITTDVRGHTTASNTRR